MSVLNQCTAVVGIAGGKEQETGLLLLGFVGDSEVCRLRVSFKQFSSGQAVPLHESEETDLAEHIR